VLAHLEKSRAKFLAVADRVPDARWRESSAPGRWSTAEIVAHVTIVEEATVFGMRRILRSAPKPVPFLKRIHPPVAIAAWRARKIQTPIALDANRVQDKAKSIAGLAIARLGTLEFVESTKDRNLSPYRFPHPFLGSLNIYDWLRMIGYHELRHAKQIRELVEIFTR
jgi:hypothetical protein